MQVFLAQVINGLSLGSIYVLLVTGFNLLLLVAMIIHFAYPQVVVFSMYIAWVVLRYTNNSVPLAVLASVGASVAINLATAPLFQKIMKNREEVDINSTMVVSMGIGMIITDVLSHGFNKGLPISFPDAAGGGRGPVPGGADQPAVRAGRSPWPSECWPSPGCSCCCTRRGRGGPSGPSPRTRPARAWWASRCCPPGLQSYALSGVLGGLIARAAGADAGLRLPGAGRAGGPQGAGRLDHRRAGQPPRRPGGGPGPGHPGGPDPGLPPGSWSNAIAFVVLLVVILAKPRGLFGIKL